jgi:hypothetical protein
MRIAISLGLVIVGEGQVERRPGRNLPPRA